MALTLRKNCTSGISIQAHPRQHSLRKLRPRSYSRFSQFKPKTASGRAFLTKDPIWPQGGINPYTYVYNNPLKYTDPSGLYPDDPMYWPNQPAADQTYVNQGAAAGAAAAALVIGGVAAGPTITSEASLAYGAAQSAGTTAVNACLANPALCTQLGVSAGAGLVNGIERGYSPTTYLDPNNPSLNGVYVPLGIPQGAAATGLPGVVSSTIGYAIGNSIQNACRGH